MTVWTATDRVAVTLSNAFEVDSLEQEATLRVDVILAVGEIHTDDD